VSCGQPLAIDRTDLTGPFMPPQLIYDISAIDLDRTLHGPDFIRTINPQRGDMEHLNGVVHLGPDRVLGYKDVRDDEFWVPGHIPGRPLLPGVIIIEAAAQAASFFTRVQLGWDGFIGFGGVTDVKFRQPVSPGVRLYLLLLMIWNRHKRVCCKAQGLVNGNVVFEGEIIGVAM
jgi:3-hydroxyacyl-[acyl-carrier-protein] dehydratase